MKKISYGSHLIEIISQGSKVGGTDNQHPMRRLFGSEDCQATNNEPDQPFQVKKLVLDASNLLYLNFIQAWQ